MFKLPLLSWVGNAAAVLLGCHGDVSAQARRAGCSRQTVYDHAERVQGSIRHLSDAQPACLTNRERNRHDLESAPPCSR